jgi:hypothetical protein
VCRQPIQIAVLVGAAAASHFCTAYSSGACPRAGPLPFTEASLRPAPLTPPLLLRIHRPISEQPPTTCCWCVCFPLSHLL